MLGFSRSDCAGAEMQRSRCQVQMCRDTKIQRRFRGAEVQRCSRGENVHRYRCRASGMGCRGTDVQMLQRCKCVDVQKWCRGKEEVHRCRGAEVVQRC